MSIMFVAGYDNVGTLAAVSPQPRVGPAEPSRVTTAMDQMDYSDGVLVAKWEYNDLTDTQYAALLTAFGFTESAESVQCTVTTYNRAMTLDNYNAILTRPRTVRRDWYIRSVEFELRLVETL